MTTKLFDDVDSSGKVLIAAFQERTPTESSSHVEAPCAVPNDMVVVGGGATSGTTDPGAFLTASHPSDDRSAWVASSHDHRVVDQHRLTVFAIGMKISGMSRADLLNHMQYKQVDSLPAPHPEATVGPAPAGHVLISGGFRVDGPGNFATETYPSLGSFWKAASKDHIDPSPVSITTYAVSVRSVLPNVGTVDCFIRENTSSEEAHPQTAASVERSCAMTGIGAKTLTAGPGQLIWHLRPEPNGVVVSSKDHQKPSSGKITAFVLGIRIS